ncbi:MAG: PorT family protein [Bacteroidetes bacterium]|nr:PorT family protein [Bacteroidota bacterium]
MVFPFKLFFLLFALICNLPVFAQSIYGIKLNVGISKIPVRSSGYTSTSSNSTIASHHSSPSFAAGGFYRYNFKNSYFGTELIYDLFSGVQKYHQDHVTDEAGTYIGYIRSRVVRKYGYLAIPVYYGHNFNRFSINYGFQAGYMLTGDIRDVGEIYLSGNYSKFDNLHDNATQYLNRFTIGPRAAVSYDLNDKFSLEINAYYGLNNVYKDSVFSQRVMQILGGIRFNL